MTKLFQKAALLLILFFLTISPTYAQRELNYIYLFDCTQSMKGYAGAKDIWEPTKEYLNESISMLPPNATVSIIPFQDINYPVIQFIAKDFNWRRVEKLFDKYVNTRTRTNICAAWDEGIKLIDPNKENYFFILTDGIDNVEGIPALTARIKNWCNRFKNSYAFYVMLTKKAENNEILKAIKESCNIIDITIGDKPKPIVRLSYNSISINSDQLEKVFDIRIPIIGRYKANIRNNDQNFEANIIDGIFDNGKASYRIKTTSRNASAQSERYRFKYRVVSDELNITNPEVEVTVVNIPERILYLVDESEVNIGRARFYSSFLFVPKKEQSILEFDLKPDFNYHAKIAQSKIRFQISGRDGGKDYDVFFNGQPITSGEFELNSDIKTAVLGVKFHDNAREGKRYFNLKAKNPYNLNRINDEAPENFELSLRAHYQYLMNPLLKGLIWFLIIALIILLLYAIFNRISNSKIKYNVALIEPVSKALLRKNEARKLVLTSNRNLKQSMYNLLLYGKTKYVYDDFWLDNFELIAAQKGVRISRSKVYNCEPYSGVLKPNDENNGVYSLIHFENKESIILKIK